MNVPSNHKFAERILIRHIRSGEWTVDGEGRVWIVAKIVRNELVPIEPRRAERKLPDGYLHVRSMRGGVRTTGLAHRLVWQALRGDIPDGLTINHINGRKDDNRPSNLEVATYSENLLHCHANLNPTVLRGSKNGGAKLTESDVIDLRNARARGESLNSLAARFGISFQQVSTIAKGRRWAHVKAAPLSTQDGRLVCRQARNLATGRFVPPQ